MAGRFLAGVGALLWNSAANSYLLLRRAQDKDYAAGLWECVTGRVEQGEGFEQALRREVREELGVEVWIEYIIGTTHFYRGEASPDQELLGVVYCCTIAGQGQVRLSPEHDACRWATIEEARALLGDQPSEAWLLEVLRRAEFIQTHLTPDERSFHRFNGFETDALPAG